MKATHIVKRESGFIAGWFEQAQVDSGYVAEFVAECNTNVPGDPAHIEEIPEWPVCEHGVAIPADDCVACKLAAEDAHGAPYVIPVSMDIDYRLALAIARSKHPSRVVAITNVYRYARFTETRWCATCASVERSPSHVAEGHFTPSHEFSPEVEVRLFGQHIATFHTNGVTLWSRGYQTTSTSEALSNLVTGGYFYHDKGQLIFSAYETTGTHRTGQPVAEGGFYPYKLRSAR